MAVDIDAIRKRHEFAGSAANGGWYPDDGLDAHADREALLAEVDRLTEALQSIAYEGGDCLAVEGGSASRPCQVCAVCTAREALVGEVA